MQWRWSRTGPAYHGLSPFRQRMWRGRQTTRTTQITPMSVPTATRVGSGWWTLDKTLQYMFYRAEVDNTDPRPVQSRVDIAEFG